MLPNPRLYRLIYFKGDLRLVSDGFVSRDDPYEIVRQYDDVNLHALEVWNSESSEWVLV